MKRWEQAFFLLLRSGLWRDPPRSTSLFPLSDEEWTLLFHESCRQTVQGLLFSGFQQLPEELFPPESLVIRWLADVNRIEQKYNEAQQATAVTWRMLRSVGCEPVLLKGLAVGILYEHPEERVYGDVDWYISDIDAVVELLHRNGISTERHADRSHSFCFHDTVIELHDQLTDLQTKAHSNVLEMLQQEGLPSALNLSSSTILHPSPMQTLIMLQAHILKHAITVGVGLRQFCDLARAYHAYHSEMNSARLMDYYRRLGLLRWTELTHTFLNAYLGVPPQELPAATNASEKECRRLARRVLRWGNFGQPDAKSSKLHTTKQIARNLPFALHYAPSLIVRHLSTLIRNQNTKIR